MKVAIYKHYGKPEVVEIIQIKKPEPKENEMLVKVKATTVTSGDWRMRAGDPFAIRFYNGLFKPKRTILGHEFSGVIESTGKKVLGFNKGDEVFGTTGYKSGAHAEFLVVPSDGVIIRKPARISHENAAAVPIGALTALFFLRKVNIFSNKKVLINGASGSVGSYAVQLAKYFGAEVTAVCSTQNLELARKLGADKVIDYTSQDFTKTIGYFDFIFDAVGKASFRSSKKALKNGGTFLTVAMNPMLLFQSLAAFIFGKKKLITAISKTSKEDLLFLTDLIEKGNLTIVTDKIYPLSNIVVAHQHAQTGHKKGNIVIII